MSREGADGPTRADSTRPRPGMGHSPSTRAARLVRLASHQAVGFAPRRRARRPSARNPGFHHRAFGGGARRRGLLLEPLKDRNVCGPRQVRLTHARRRRDRVQGRLPAGANRPFRAEQRNCQDRDVIVSADPGKRLLLPFSEMVPDGRVRITAIDRASGLRADRIVMEDLTARSSFPSEISFFHLFSISHAGKTAASVPPSVKTMREWGHRLAARLPAIVARARLLGMSANGDVVVVAEASGAGFGRSMARWFLLDAQTGREKTRGELEQGRFVGGMSPRPKQHLRGG